MLGILVVLGKPGKHAWRGELHDIEQLIFRINLVADDVDATNFGSITFLDVESHSYAVALHILDGCFHFHGILAASDILPLQFLHGFVQNRFIQDASLRQPDRFQIFGQLILGEILHAVDFNTGHCRSFLDYHNQYALLDIQPDVLEKTGGEKRMQRSGCALVIQRIAYLYRQVAEHSTRLGALYTFDADVLDDERFHGPGS